MYDCWCGLGGGEVGWRVGGMGVVPVNMVSARAVLSHCWFNLDIIQNDKTTSIYVAFISPSADAELWGTQESSFCLAVACYRVSEGFVVSREGPRTLGSPPPRLSSLHKASHRFRLFPKYCKIKQQNATRKFCILILTLTHTNASQYFKTERSLERWLSG